MLSITVRIDHIRWIEWFPGLVEGNIYSKPLDLSRKAKFPVFVSFKSMDEMMYSAAQKYRNLWKQPPKFIDPLRPWNRIVNGPKTDKIDKNQHAPALAPGNVVYPWK